MALTRPGTARAVQASTSNAAAGTTTSSGQSIGYGDSGIAVITNGGTGPTIACALYIDFSADNSTFINGPAVGSGDTVASSVTTIPYSFGIGGGGDWNYYRTRFTGNTGQSCTVIATDSTTSGV